MSGGHAPVLAEAAVAALSPIDRGVYVDATFGAGGYTRAILAAANCAVYGFDRDPTAIERAGSWAQAYAGRLQLINRPFADLEEALAARDVRGIDGIVFDLGVSSMQLDEAERGFSFRFDGPLNMRMDGGAPNAADLVNEAEIGDLAAIFRVLGEEKRAGRIARAIVAARVEAPIATTLGLSSIIEAAAPRRRPDEIHPATRAFQALRIFVNDELGQLARALMAAERLLRPAGRIVVVAFHSLEDRIVKQFLVDRSGNAPAPSRHAPPVARAAATFRLLTEGVVTADAAEVERNPRSRSAKLRAAIRTEAPAVGGDWRDLAPAPELSVTLRKWSQAHD